MTLSRAIGAIALFLPGLVPSAAYTQEFKVLPATFPAPSSVGVELSALNSNDSATSRLSGQATIDLKWTPLGEVSQATIVDMVLQLDDEMDLSLLLGAFSANIAPGATRVRLLEPGPATPVVDDLFSQTENTFAFEGEILLNDEVFDVSTFGEITADLNDIQLVVSDQEITTEASIDLSFAASIGIFPVNIDIDGSVLSIFYPGDFNDDGMLDAADIDLLAAAIRNGLEDAVYDLNRDGIVDLNDHDQMISERLNTYYGDTNLDGKFDSEDFVFAFVRGGYEDDVEANSGWADGDWNGDAEFDSGDLVKAFQGGGWNLPPRQALPVPEPSAATMLLPIWLLALRRRRSGE